MAKRFTDTDLWDKEWFMDLPCRLKCLVKMVRDKADLCGVWSPNWIIANAYIGEKVTEKELLEIDGGNQFFKMPNGKIFCAGFIEFQYGELSEKSPVHRKIIMLLKQHGIYEKYKKIGCKYPIDRVQEEDKDKEEEKEEDNGGAGGKLFYDLTENEIDLTIEFIHRTHPSKKIFQPPDIENYWRGFLLVKDKFYEDRSKVIFHFMNWLKKQDYEQRNNIGAKKSNSEARIEAYKNW